MTGGIKIRTPLAEIRTANQVGKNNLGVLVSTGSIFKKLPVEFRYGNLSGSGSLSKLNSPELSNGSSPFSGSIMNPGVVTANLPGYTSFSKPESFFFQVKLKQPFNKPFSLSANIWVSPENSSPVFSTMLSNSFFSNRLTLKASATTGLFRYEDNSSSSWFLEAPFYSAGKHFCSLFQFSADYKNKTGKAAFHTGFMAAVYETPFGPYTAVYRADLSTSIKQIELYTSAFLNSYEDTLTSSGKKLEPSCQLKTGFVLKKPLLTKKNELIFLKFGTNAYTKIILIKNEYQLRINSGIQLSSDITAFSLSASGNMTMLSPSPELPPQEIRKDSISIQVKNSWYLKTFIPSLTFAAEKKFSAISDNSDEMKYKLLLNLTNNSREKISGNCTFSFSTKEQKIIDKKFSSSLNCRFNYKMITIIGKLSASLE